MSYFVDIRWVIFDVLLFLQTRKYLRQKICSLSKQIAVYQYLTPCSSVNMHSSTDVHEVRTHQTAIYSQRRNNLQPLSLSLSHTHTHTHTRTHARTQSLLRKLQSTTLCCRPPSRSVHNSDMCATCFFFCLQVWWGKLSSVGWTNAVLVKRYSRVPPSQYKTCKPEKQQHCGDVSFRSCYIPDLVRSKQ